MADSPKYPPLKPLHPNSSLNAGKLELLERLSTETLRASLLPGRQDCLKTRADGTILDGHHHVHVLRQRGFDIDNFPREVVVKDQE